ncbi:MAG: Coenzyme F420 hydrogenase/dehydrogenase, beta subunit C-terminal domain [Desulfosarcina sp.]|nr:Coenzyme F420 hydrogenase/dehydrogenase, beta subunit C-terminal domain [Desulfosarcina sp.]MBC2742136.1 Coenzyme F420 hydrogenase/dehydrogenase, beta subunit C-terminal domain [Desulfosarcina sp.]MBC2765049.1 formate dehydrogenase [Desulfosarcina sp.]
MIVEFENTLNTPDAVRAFLKRLLDDALADAVLTAFASPHSPLPMPTLMIDSQLLDRAVPLAPAAPLNTARMAARVLSKDIGKRIAVVLRPCEIRALIEMEKLSQCTLDPAILISMDCFGRMENDRYLELAATQDDPESAFYATPDLQEAVCPSCRACLRFIPENVDVTLCLAGQSDKKGVTLVSGSLKGEKVLKKLGGTSTDLPLGRQADIDRIMARRQTHREEMTTGAAARMADMAVFQQTIANCLNCYNCRVACPVCYCKECVFVTDVFAHRPEILMGRAMKKGAVKIPTDTTMFHLTRMAHIAHACVGCGQCSSVCPSSIPVADLFITVSEKVQEHYGYIPGQDPQRPWPFLVVETDKQVE